MKDSDAIETSVKLHIYGVISETTKVPTADEIAGALNYSLEDVEAALIRLGARRLLVLEPGSRSKIRMAPPFSAVETPFLTKISDKSYYANCVWDALGVAAALHKDADVVASDAATHEPISVLIRNGSPVSQECVIHFAVPASKWWDDIIYT